MNSIYETKEKETTYESWNRGTARRPSPAGKAVTAWEWRPTCRAGDVSGGFCVGGEFFCEPRQLEWSVSGGSERRTVEERRRPRTKLGFWRVRLRLNKRLAIPLQSYLIPTVRRTLFFTGADFKF